jgi:hypothetical protein
MMAAPARAWHGFKQIFGEHWEGLPHAQPRYQTAHEEGLGATRRACGNPEQMGDGAYRCRQWGQGTHRVAMRWKASLGWRCAKVDVDNGVSQGRTRLHEGVRSRHLILTGPAMFRTTFSPHAAVVWRALRRGGVQCLDACESAVRGKALRGGASVVLHPHGRHGPSHPPRHLSATRGGCAGQGQRGEPLPDLP